MALFYMPVLFNLAVLVLFTLFHYALPGYLFVFNLNNRI